MYILYIETKQLTQTICTYVHIKLYNMWYNINTAAYLSCEICNQYAMLQFSIKIPYELLRVLSSINL